ncbi:unnamed protein product [Diplocarpon coronariae]
MPERAVLGDPRSDAFIARSVCTQEIEQQSGHDMKVAMGVSPGIWSKKYTQLGPASNTAFVNPYPIRSAHESEIRPACRYQNEYLVGSPRRVSASKEVNTRGTSRHAALSLDLRISRHARQTHHSDTSKTESTIVHSVMDGFGIGNDILDGIFEYQKVVAESYGRDKCQVGDEARSDEVKAETIERHAEESAKLLAALLLQTIEATAMEKTTVEVEDCDKEEDEVEKLSTSQMS